MVRSFSSITVLATITAGIAKMIMNDWTSMLQQYIGMRFSDMPGARILRMVDDEFGGHAQRGDLRERDHLRPDIDALAGRELRTGKRRIRKPAGVRDRVAEGTAV